MNRTEFVDPKGFGHFYSLHSSVGRVLMIVSPSEKEVKVRGFDGSSRL